MSDEAIEAELARIDYEMRDWKPKHKNCGGACHKCPDLDGEVMPGCYGGMYNIEGCYCRPDKLRVAHSKCPRCRCPVISVEVPE